MADHSRAGALPGWFCNLVVVAAWLALATWFVVGVPQYKSRLEGLGVELDEATERAIAISDWVVNFWYVLFLPFVAYAIVRPLLVDAFRNPGERIAACLGGVAIPLVIYLVTHLALEATWRRFLGG